jgi:hypothetical protein
MLQGLPGLRNLPDPQPVSMQHLQLLLHNHNKHMLLHLFRHQCPFLEFCRDPQVDSIPQNSQGELRVNITLYVHRDQEQLQVYLQQLWRHQERKKKKRVLV